MCVGTKCLRCFDKGFVGSDGTCKLCATKMANCEKCSVQSGNFKCEKCAAGYKNKEGTCVSEPNNWPDNCRRAKPSNTNFVCEICNSGYYLDTTCKACPANCMSCRKTTSGVICDMCSQGFSWHATDSKCKPCTLSGCKVCVPI